MYIYSAYGLIISSELKLDGLTEISDTMPQVTINFGNVPSAIVNPIITNERQQISTNEFLLEVKDVARFYVNNGKHVIIEKLPVGHAGDIQVFLMGTVFAYILQYHDYLVLHGSAILINNQAVIFSGNSGAGKSTIALAFAKKGYTILTDDMAAIKYSNTNDLKLIPGWPRLKLWQDALNHFGESTATLLRVQNKLEKFEFPIDNINLSAVAISHFYELIPDEGDLIRLNSIDDKIQGLNLLIKNTFRYNMLKGLNKRGLHFKQCALLADTIKIKTIMRPRNSYQLEDLVNLIKTDIG